MSTACVCEIKPLPKENGSIYKAFTFEHRREPKKGVMVRVCPLVTTEMEVLWSAVEDGCLDGGPSPER